MVRKIMAASCELRVARRAPGRLRVASRGPSRNSQFATRSRSGSRLDQEDLPRLDPRVGEVVELEDRVGGDVVLAGDQVDCLAALHRVVDRLARGLLGGEAGLALVLGGGAGGDLALLQRPDERVEAGPVALVGAEG